MVACFSQRGEVLYASTSRARCLGTTPNRFFFRAWGLGQLRRSRSSTDHRILSTNPRGIPPFLVKIYIPPHFTHNRWYTPFCLKPYPFLFKSEHGTTEQPARPPTSIWCCGPIQRPFSGVADPYKSTTCGTSCAADAAQMVHTGAADTTGPLFSC